MIILILFLTFILFIAASVAGFLIQIIYVIVLGLIIFAIGSAIYNGFKGNPS